MYQEYQFYILPATFYNNIYISLEKCSLHKLKDFYSCIFVHRPGYTRLSFPYFASDEFVDYIINAVILVAKHGWKLLPQVRQLHYLSYYYRECLESQVFTRFNITDVNVRPEWLGQFFVMYEHDNNWHYIKQANVSTVSLHQWYNVHIYVAGMCNGRHAGVYIHPKNCPCLQVKINIGVKINGAFTMKMK